MINTYIFFAQPLGINPVENNQKTSDCISGWAEQISKRGALLSSSGGEGLIKIKHICYTDTKNEYTCRYACTTIAHALNTCRPCSPVAYLVFVIIIACLDPQERICWDAPNATSLGHLLARSAKCILWKKRGAHLKDPRVWQHKNKRNQTRKRRERRRKEKTKKERRRRGGEGEKEKRERERDNGETTRETTCGGKRHYR